MRNARLGGSPELKLWVKRIGWGGRREARSLRAVRGEMDRPNFGGRLSAMGASPLKKLERSRRLTPAVKKAGLHWFWRMRRAMGTLVKTHASAQLPSRL